MAIVTLDWWKDLLGVTTSDDDVQMQRALEAAEAAVKAYCRLNFESQAYTEYHTGNQRQAIALRQVPVTAVAGVWLNTAGYFGQGSAFGSANQLTEGVDFVLDRSPDGSSSKSGILYRIGTVWPMLPRVSSVGRLGADFGPAWGNIKVAYTAGYAAASMPADLKMAVCLVAQQARQLAPEGGRQVQEERLKDYSYKYATEAIHDVELASVRTTLATYRNLGW